MKRCSCCGKIQVLVSVKDGLSAAYKAVAEYLDPPKFMVVGVDNFARDYQTETLAARDLSAADAKEMAAALNARNGRHAPTHYVVKPNDYVPYVFEGY